MLNLVSKWQILHKVCITLRSQLACPLDSFNIKICYATRVYFDIWELSPQTTKISRRIFEKKSMPQPACPMCLRTFL